VAEWLEGHGIVLAGLWAEHFNVGRLIGLFQQLTSGSTACSAFRS
jgi:AI-2 transport protein TqsA